MCFCICFWDTFPNFLTRALVDSCLCFIYSYIYTILLKDKFTDGPLSDRPGLFLFLTVMNVTVICNYISWWLTNYSSSHHTHCNFNFTWIFVFMPKAYFASSAATNNYFLIHCLVYIIDTNNCIYYAQCEVFEFPNVLQNISCTVCSLNTFSQKLMNGAG